MFGTIRKHQTWLWVVIIGVTIISFYSFFNPNPRNNPGRRVVDSAGIIAGQRISQEEFDTAKKGAYLRSFFMNNANWPDETKFDAAQEAYQRLLLIKKAEAMGIRISDQLVDQAAKNTLRQLEQVNIHNVDILVKQVLAPRGLGLDDFERYIRSELTLSELISTVAMGGRLVTPAEARSIYERERQEVSADVAIFSASNYLANIIVNTQAVSEFYANHQPDYRLPDRVQVSYVAFPLTDYLTEAEQALGKVTNLTERIDGIYEQYKNKTNFFKDAKTPEEAKARIRGEFQTNEMAVAARKAANAFATELMDKDLVRAESLAVLAKQKGLEVKVSAPFDQEGPKEFKVGSLFGKEAFTLTTNNPVAGPIPGEDGFYEIALDKKLPSELPPFDQIRDKVTEDFRLKQATDQARQAGLVFSITVTNSIAQGKAFADACAEAKVQVIHLPPFSISTQTLSNLTDEVSLEQLKSTAFTMLPGKVSPFQQTAQGGFILDLKARLPMDQAKMNAELPRFTSLVRQRRENDVFQTWFRDAWRKDVTDAPYLKQRQTAASSAGRR